MHTTPLNHVGLWIDDLPKAVEWLSANGVRFAPGGIRKGAAGFDITFLHPKGNEEFPIGGEGVLIELVQAPPRWWTPSPDWLADPARPGFPKPSRRSRGWPRRSNSPGLEGVCSAASCRSPSSLAGTSACAAPPSRG